MPIPLVRLRELREDEASETHEDEPVTTATIDHEAFLKELPALLVLGAKGQFALIHSAHVVELFPTFHAARIAGYDRFGIEPFLVQEVTDEVRAEFFSRLLQPCRA